MTDNKKPLAQMSPDELCFAYANPCATPRHLLSHGDALRALIQRATIEATERDWQPSAADYDRAIHHNPDARAWADMFVQTFPRLADKYSLMVGWFANAMMAMHDSMPAAATARERDVAHTQLAEAQSLADRLQGERDTLAWDLGVAERKLASAGREGMNEAIEFVRVWRGFEVDLAGECGPSTGNVLLREMRNFRDNHYLVPTPADSGTEGVSDGTLRASDVAFAVLAASTLPAARANIERLLASTLPAVRANIERLAVALAASPPVRPTRYPMIDVVYVVFIKTDNVLPYIHRIFRSEERANEEVKVILSQVRSELFTVWVDKQEVY